MEMTYQETVEANRQYHNAHAKDYDAMTMQGHYKRVEQMFMKHPGQDFLDLGCGTGVQMDIAKQYFKNVSGIDISEEMVKIASGVSLNVKVAEVSDTKLPSGGFDFINCYSVLHHLYDHDLVILEAYRLLRPDGVFYSDNDPNRGFYRLFKWWLLFRRKFLRKKDKMLSNELKELEKKAEFHQQNGLDPNVLCIYFYLAGFCNVKINYHYPENPDTFTKILMFVNRFLKWNNLYYYFSITAIK